MSLTLSPLPQLFPRLDELLNLPGRREMVAGDPATEITTLIEIAHRGAREMREPMTQVFQVLPAQNFFRELRTPGHNEGILACSLFVRLRFIIRKTRILERLKTNEEEASSFSCLATATSRCSSNHCVQNQCRARIIRQFSFCLPEQLSNA